MKHTEPTYLMPIEVIPDSIGGIPIDLEVKERLAQGLESPFYNALVTQDGSIENGKFSLSYNQNTHELNVHYNLQQPKLFIPDRLFGIELSDEQKEKLLNHETLGPIIIKGQDFYVNIDDELNKVVVKTGYEIQIPDLIGGYTLDPIEKNQLARGLELDTKIFEKDGVFFSSKLSLSKDNKGLVFSDLKEISKERAAELKKMFNVAKASSDRRIEKETLLIGMDASLNYLYDERPKEVIIKEVKNPQELVNENNKLEKLQSADRTRVNYTNYNRTSQGYTVEADNTFIPHKLKGVVLSDQQRQSLREGNSTLVEGLVSKKGNKFSAFVKINPHTKAISFKNVPTKSFKSPVVTPSQSLGHEK